MLMRRLALGLMVAGLAFGCDNSRQQRYPQPGYPPQPGGVMPPAPPTPNMPTQPVQPPPGSLPPVYNDPINGTNIGFMRQRSQEVIRELVAALPQAQAGLVSGIPLVIDDTVGEVNAFAACSNGTALMAISDGLMEIQANMARARATDEVFRTQKFDQYINFVAQNQQPEQPIVKPPPGLFDPNQDVDGVKVKRQHELFDEELAFVLGHELSHHYLNHTGCAGGGGGSITPADIGRVLSGAVPGLNQPNELAADQSGTDNLLTAGARRPAYKWTEGGALLTLAFFQALRTISPGEELIFAFEITHPPPWVRRPSVQQAANNWRARGGTPAAPNPFPFPFPIPGLGG
jgi:hypothetical protein